MAIYVDNAKIPSRGSLWCHMVADTIEELHEFAINLGVKRHWFHSGASYPHYDIKVDVRDEALLRGAKIGSRVQIISCAKQLKAEQLARKSKASKQLNFSY